MGKIPTLEEEYIISRIVYNGMIMDKLPANAKFKEAEEKLFEIGNAPWFRSHTDYFRADMIEEKFTRSSHLSDDFFIKHSGCHFLTAGAHTDQGEAQTLMMQYVAARINLGSDELIKKYLSDRELAQKWVRDDCKGTLNEVFTYDENHPINSQNNFQLCRITFNSILASENFKDKAGIAYRSLDNAQLMDVDAHYMKPHDLMFDTKLSYIEFSEKGMSLKSGIRLPRTDIELIEKTCAKMNELAETGHTTVNKF